MSTDRPILLGQVAAPVAVKVTRGGKSRIRFADRPSQMRRVDDHLQDAFTEMREQVTLAHSLQASDPELVLIFEALDDRQDLEAIAQKIGFEVLIEAEDEVAPDGEFELVSERPLNPAINSCVHAICVNKHSLEEIQKRWSEYKKTGQVTGVAPLRDLFVHLKDVRPWSPVDRLQHIDWDQYFDNRVDGLVHLIEIELWFRRGPSIRASAEEKVRKLVAEAGGEVVTSVTIPSIGYHALQCEVTTETLRSLANGEFDEVRLAKSANVMYLRVSGQSAEPIQEGVAPEDRSSTIEASGQAILCVLDGVPAANHPLLRDRVIVWDPDDLSSVAEVADRKHGTAMASVAIWDDLNKRLDPAPRPILVRPILAPAPDTLTRTEEIPRGSLAPDVMQRVFRELFEGDGEAAPVAPEVAIINLSVGDPSAAYDTVISSWARMIDWLSYTYGVLVVISAGNHSRLPLTGGSKSFASLKGEGRRTALLEAQALDQNNRRLLSPAESVNAITVGAVHSDASSVDPVGYRLDATDGQVSASPVSAVGGGYRHAIKPDVAAPGGRAVFAEPMLDEDAITFMSGGANGPGIRVAFPVDDGESHTLGTSPAAAAISKKAAALHDLVSEISSPAVPSRRQHAAAVKALLLHSANPLIGEFSDDLSQTRLLGNGLVERDFSDGCDANEAVILYMGSIGAAQSRELLLPLPDGLNVRETKRITATLAWLSPVNWRHRQYRRASLSFAKPVGGIPKLDKPLHKSSFEAKRGASTSQHLVWETEGAFSGGFGSALSLTVKCFEQAGGLHGESIDFAVAVSLWVSPAIGVDVYSQVRQQVAPRVRVGG